MKYNDDSGGFKEGDEFLANVRGAYFSFHDNDGHTRLKYIEECCIVEETASSPIRTVTRSEVVPGAYGGVIITADGAITMQRNTYTADELREAAHVLNQIAEALEDV